MLAGSRRSAASREYLPWGSGSIPKRCDSLMALSLTRPATDNAWRALCGLHRALRQRGKRIFIAFRPLSRPHLLVSRETVEQARQDRPPPFRRADAARRDRLAGGALH